MTPWPTVTLHDISRPKQWKTISKAELKDEGYPVYGANGVIGYFDDYNHEHPTVLIGCRGSCGSVHVSAPKSWVTGNAMALDDLDTTRVDQGFLVYALRADGLQAAVTGTSQPQITRTSLKHVRIPLPPIEEQRRIAAVLDAADELRAKRREALAKLDTLTQAIFIDMFGDPATNPARWPTIPLGRLALKFSDGPFGSNLKSDHYQDSGVRVVRLQNIGSGDFVDDVAAYISDEHFTTLRKHECRPGDVLVATMGDPNLRACIQPEWLNVALNKADCVQIRVDPTIATSHWICVLLNHPSTEDMARSLVRGQTRSRISMGRLRELEVPVPPLDLQHEFGQRRTAAMRQRERCYESSTSLNRLFGSLQQRAFRGEL